MKKLLVISNTYPPVEGIGGRRWVKFVKYLSKSVDVWVICTQKPTEKRSSTWQKDICNPHKISYINSFYPSVLGAYPISIFAKITYRLALLWVKINSKGNYFDKSSIWNPKVNLAVEEKIKEGYHNVVVSVAPFQMAYHLIPLIDKYPHVNFMVDFRDPWTNNKTSYGFERLSPHRKAFEQLAEQKVIQKYHKIISVSQHINQYLKQHSPQDKFFEIPNGFDAQDFTNLTPSLDPTPKHKIVFGGTFYAKAEPYLQKLLNLFSELSFKNSILSDQIEIHFYGDHNLNTKDYKLTNVQFHGTVDQRQTHQAISNAAATLLFLTDDIHYSFSTKFCEYLYFQKPILVCAKTDSFTANYVVQHQIGAHISTQTSYAEFEQLIQRIVQDRLPFNPLFDCSKFSIDTISKSLFHLLDA